MPTSRSSSQPPAPMSASWSCPNTGPSPRWSSHRRAPRRGPGQPSPGSSRLSGLDEASLAFDARPIKPFGRWQNPSWLTLCKREELDALLAASPPSRSRPPLEPSRRCCRNHHQRPGPLRRRHVLGPEARNCVLVDLRANNSVVAIVVNGQGVATSTIPTGSLQFQAPPANGPPDARPGGTDPVGEARAPETPGRHPPRPPGRSGAGKSAWRSPSGSKTTRTAACPWPPCRSS